MNAIKVNTKKELKLAINNSADVIELQGEILKQYKAYKLLSKYALPATSTVLGTILLSKFLKGFQFNSILKAAAAQGDKVDPQIILSALAIVIPAIVYLIPIMTALFKGYEEIETENQFGKSKFKKKSK